MKDKQFLLVTGVDADKMYMTERWGAFDELNLDMTDKPKVLRNIERLRDHGKVGASFEWDITPDGTEWRELTRIG